MPGCGGRQTGYIKAEEHKKTMPKEFFIPLASYLLLFKRIRDALQQLYALTHLFISCSTYFFAGEE